MAPTATSASSGGDKQAFLEKRFRNVIDYIYDHLDDPLDLNRLADIACLSPCHWHRIYHATTGETLAATVRRLRLHRAAGELVSQKDLSIERIALHSGYTSVQAFTRAFSESYGMPPARYRKEGSHNRYRPDLTQTTDDRSHLMNEVTIKHLDAFTVTGVPHTGPYMNIGNAFEKLFAWLSMNNLITPKMRSVGLYLDDPNTVPESTLRSAACATTEGALPEGDETVQPFLIEGGEYAILCHKGPYSEMHTAYQWLYGEWLPISGREVADQPCFEEYLNNPREVAPAELVTHICLPLKPQS